MLKKRSQPVGLVQKRDPRAVRTRDSCSDPESALLPVEKIFSAPQIFMRRAYLVGDRMGRENKLIGAQNGTVVL
jgi:hypothetical protein